MEQPEQCNDDDYVLAYLPGNSMAHFVRTNEEEIATDIGTMWINAKVNPAMAMAQQAEKDNPTKGKLPMEYQVYQDVFEKKAAERFPEARPYDHAIDLKDDFVPKDCKVYPLSPME